ncbi:MAG: LysR family transcriptional regulator [Gammaproteobacteria bacterium]|nr:LysR family transcriptional regulator [Gammaproteobacteria bacterium]MBU1556109.1 LysR family transcriptional regulator [Gammaproteobacteria bacterium]MBU2070241.1 LysR family transcriptional regulator [Gammaproteobacteria bacterium]MBU2183944.1 LysR family transcriptional regulator [Gammaproteobacteria bacterium]MBU2206748.1 LysR family transcriptional regulator [Gammaproteobacteria bacterium]
MKHWIGISEFVAVAEQQSFTKAAKQLGISVAQVSRNIAELEASLAIKLLYRSTRSVSLTEEGLLYLQHCRHLVAGLEEANRTLANLKATPRGQIKLTAPVFYGETRIAPLLHDFMQQYPDTELDLQLTNNKLDLVQGGFDLAIRLGTLESSSLIARKLASRTQYVVASPVYLAQNGTPQNLTELARHQCLTGTVAQWRFTQHGKVVQFKPQGRIVCNSGVALMDAALKGLGLVQLPDYYVGTKLQSGDLVAVLNELRQPDDGIWALYPQNRHLSAKVRVLVDYLAAKLGAATPL